MENITKISNPYQAAAYYRANIGYLVKLASKWFHEMNVTWAHAKIFADEIKAVSVPDTLGPNYKAILEEGLNELRKMVNVC